VEFVEAPLFTGLLKKYLDDDGYHLLQLALAQNPEFGAVIQGTGGFRKARWRDERRGKGKRGGLRVIYYHFEEENLVWLLTVYDKSEMEDLSQDQKRLLRTAIEREKQARKTKRRT
jgi:mRNA-degrading endonuclease RelE of RelBE toxin-antitoxin system